MLDPDPYQCGSETLEWTVKCWPNVSGKGMRLLMLLGRVQPSHCPQITSRLPGHKITSTASTSKVRIAVAAKLLDSAGTKEDHGTVAG